MDIGLRQECVLLPFFFIVYMNWIEKCSQADECAAIRNCKISRLLFADDLVLLSFTGSDIQRALNSFADACKATERGSTMTPGPWTLGGPWALGRPLVSTGPAEGP